MNSCPRKRICAGLTIVEVLVVAAILIILAALFLPSLSRSRPARGPSCMNNLRQIDIGLLLFASDHQERFPIEVSIPNYDFPEVTNIGPASLYFQELQPYHLNPSLFICPFETDRKAAPGYPTLNNSNISYFLNADAATNYASASLLSGDRLLQSNGTAVQPGVFVLTPQINVSWNPSNHAGGGSMGFADGHVEFVKAAKLTSVLQKLPVTTNRLCVP